MSYIVLKRMIEKSFLVWKTESLCISLTKKVLIKLILGKYQKSQDIAILKWIVFKETTRQRSQYLNPASVSVNKNKTFKLLRNVENHSQKAPESSFYTITSIFAQRVWGIYAREIVVRPSFVILNKRENVEKLSWPE